MVAPSTLTRVCKGRVLFGNDQRDSAAQGLEKLGYRQEFSRSRGLAHTLFMSLAIMATRKRLGGVPLKTKQLILLPEAWGLVAPFSTSLVGGGPVVVVWGWLLVSLLTIPIALSLGEISSKYPTSAGAYYWCYRLASPRYRLLLSWINGWLNLVGVWVICLSALFGTAQLLVAGVLIFHPEWQVTPWQTYLVFVAIHAYAGIFVVFFNRWLPMIDILSAVWTLLGIIVILVALPAKAAVGRHSVAWVLGSFDPSYSGWTPGWSFFIGLLPSAFTYSAIGMITSMAEEVHDPSIQIPQAIVYSIPIAFITGLAFLLPVVFTLPDVSTLLAVPGGQPVGVMFTLAMGTKAGGFGLWLIIFGIAMFCAVSICCAASRTTWSFARDRAMPFHQLLSKVSHSSQVGPSSEVDGVPLYAHLLATVVQLLLGLIYLGSSTAFNAFVGIAIMCLATTYAMPIAISLLNGRKQVEGKMDGEPAPYGMRGWKGKLMNACALAWIAVEIVLFSMPAVLPVTKESMNYASVVFVGFGLISAIWYLIDGRYNFAGPPVPKDVHSEASDDSESSGGHQK